MRLGMRTTLTLLLLAFGSLPASGAVLLTASAKHQDAQGDLDARLTDVARTADYQLSNDLERFRQILLTSAQNPALVQVMRDPDHQAFWKGELDQALLQLTTTFPGMIDEACRIDPAGVELGRVVKGDIAPDADLSDDESDNNPAFWPTMALPAGAVHYQAPYLSPDTERWVLAAATPLYTSGEPAGILHFEVPLAYYHRLLKAALPADGFLVLADPDGQIYLDSSAPEPAGESFPALASVLDNVRLDAGAPAVTTGEVGFGVWTSGGATYRVRYQAVEPAPGLQMTVLVGLPVVPSFLEQLGTFALPLALGGLLVLVLALALAGVLVRRPGVQAAPPTPGATGIRRPLAGVATLVLALLFASATAVGLGALNQSAYQQQQLEIALTRLDGHVRRLDALADRSEAEPGSGQAAPRAMAEAQRQVVQDLSEVSRLDADGAVAERLERAFGEYRADLDELLRLMAEDREAEARLWHQQRAHASLAAVEDAVEGASALAQAAAERVDALVNVGSAVALVLAALVMGLLSWRFTQTRRAADLLTTEQQALRRSEERFRKLVQHGAELVAILGPDGTVRYCSPSATALLGQPADELVGTGLCVRIHPEDAPAWLRLLTEAADNGQSSVRAEFRLQHADGSWRHVDAVCRNLLGDAEIGGIVLNGRDVTERKALESQLAHRAFHDELTELPNRALLVERLVHALTRSARTGGGTALLFVDLDDFKVVNDSLGHRAGDQLLIAVAQRLRASLRPGDTAARLGGDEFVVLLEDLAEATDTEVVAERVLEQLRAPFVLEERQVFVGASLGIAVAGADDTVVADDLLRRADVAMYAAKTRGKGQFLVYDPTMDGRPLERLELEADLRRALERAEFQLHYQPIVELATGRISGVEALLRWQHPERGLVPPSQFIPLAEETGLIVPIGRWVLEEACRQAQTWRARHSQAAGLVMSVNLSARQFQHPRLAEHVAAALHEAGLPAGLLKLEITESVAMEAGVGTIQTLQALKGLGVQLAIDDFGTGYSSLAYLKRFPVDTLKIDRAFVDGLGQDEQDSAIVRSVIALARTLNLSVTAEGIETREQLERLCIAACDDGQGYYFGRPQPQEHLDSLLAAGGLSLPSMERAA